MSIRLFEIPQEVKGILLFGSRARGDSDNNSDLDICVLCDDVGFEQAQRTRDRIASMIGCDRHNVSLYTEQKVESMLRKGSLFMWHLKKEGKILFSKGGYCERVLSHLRPYRRHKEDLLYYGSLLHDVRDSIDSHGVNPFDLDLLFTLYRNTCMVICNLCGRIAFGRVNVFEQAKETYGKMLQDSDGYYFLSKWKLAYSRGLTTQDTSELPTSTKVSTLIDEVARVISFALKELRA